MPKKTMSQVRKTVLDYAGDARNLWFAKPQGDDSQLLSPPPSSLPTADFDAFFLDFTDYIRNDSGMASVIVTADGLKACSYWADVVGYLFNLQ